MVRRTRCAVLCRLRRAGSRSRQARCGRGARGRRCGRYDGRRVGDDADGPVVAAPVRVDILLRAGVAVHIVAHLEVVDAADKGALGEVGVAPSPLVVLGSGVLCAADEGQDAWLERGLTVFGGEGLAQNSRSILV